MRRAANGGVNLQQAIALLIQNQAKFVSVEVESAQRFARIERDLDELKAAMATIIETLRRHDQVLSELPEAIRQKIGFKSK